MKKKVSFKQDLGRQAESCQYVQFTLAGGDGVSKAVLRYDTGFLKGKNFLCEYTWLTNSI